MKRKIISLLCMCMIFGCYSTPVYAESNPSADILNEESAISEKIPDAGSATQNTENVGSTLQNDIYAATDLSGLIGNMTESAMQGKQLTLSDALTQNFGLALDASPYFKTGSFHDEELTLDTGNMNAQYTAMAAELLNGHTDMVSALGSSDNAMTLFQSEFGDIADGLTLENFEIPSSFDPQSMITTMHDSMTSQYGDAISTGSFAAVKGSIDVGDIFSRANQGVSSDIVSGLMSADSMQSYLQNASGGIAQQMAGEYASNKQNNAGPNISDFYSNALSSTMNALDLSSSMITNSSVMSQKYAGTKNIAQRYESFSRYQNEKEWNLAKEARAKEIADSYAEKKQIVNPETVVDKGSSISSRPSGQIGDERGKIFYYDPDSQSFTTEPVN